jgi:aldehyde:ferredoxin oxidoreductase
MSIKSGYTGTVLRVDLTDGMVRKEPLEEAFSRTYIGGRGFTSRLQYDLIPPAVDPLGPENVLILAPGALTGTSAPSAARLVVAARSPLTGILGDANSGGFVGAVLKRAGYSLVLIHGRSARPVYLKIDGENLVRIASVMADKEHAAARTGLGAVMGSKNLKAVAVRSRRDFPYRDPHTFKGLVDELRQIEQNDRRAQDLTTRGTLGTLMDHHQAIGAMNTRNYQFGQFENKDKIDHEALAAEYLVRPTGCYHCSLKCDRYSVVEEGEFAGVHVDGPEYSTAVALGPGLGIDNLAAVLKGNDLANRYGMDTIDLGGVIAFSMELYQRGILTKEEADGLDLEWGNYHTMLELVRRIAYREGPFADLLGHGVHVAAQEIGRGAERYAVHVKGMTPAPLDARPVKVYNFRYAVSPRGADHLRISAPGGYALDQLPILEAAAKLNFWERVITVPDLMGVCKFAYTYYTETPDVALHRTLDILPSLYQAATGFELTREQLLETAARVVNVERAHNCRLGLTAADDTLPPRFTEDPMPEGPSKGKVYDILEPMKTAWYTVEGWDTETGIPQRETLEKLGLGDIADDLDL